MDKQKRKKSTGLPPEEIVFIGEKKTEAVNISVIYYNENEFSDSIINNAGEIKLPEDDSTVLWVNITGLHDVEVLRQLGDKFQIHSLILADIANTEHNPKIDIFDDSLFIEFKRIEYTSRAKSVESEQISLLLGSNYVLSFFEQENEVYNSIKHRIQANQSRIRKYKADYLFYSLIDSYVDTYFDTLEKINEDIEDIEDELIAQPGTKSLEAVHKLKRCLIFMRKSTWPLREIIRRLEIENHVLIRETTNIYLRDLYDHIIQTLETIETQREIVAEMLDIYLSSVSYKLNQVMKVLTIIATIFIPLTFISSIYGMNFEWMPELRWRLGYPVIMSFMFLLGLIMLYIFKRKRWF